MFGIFNVLGGWTYVGRVRVTGQWWTLEQGKCISWWGTNEGLAQLKTGPTTETKLLPANGTKWHVMATGPIYEADEAAWKEHLNEQEGGTR